MLQQINTKHRLNIGGDTAIEFDPDSDLIFDYGEPLARHTNGMRFTALDDRGKTLLTDDYFSLGGGFIVCGDEEEPSKQTGEPPHPFSDGAGLLEQSRTSGLSIPDLVYQNESSWRDKAEVDHKLTAIWDAMQACVQRGLHTEGVLPGRMAVTRRAARLYQSLKSREHESGLETMDWVNTYAIAVNEENAATQREIIVGQECFAFVIKRSETHVVGMPCERLAVIEDQIAVGIEFDRRITANTQTVVCMDLLEHLVH